MRIFPPRVTLPSSSYLTLSEELLLPLFCKRNGVKTSDSATQIPGPKLILTGVPREGWVRLPGDALRRTAQLGRPCGTESVRVAKSLVPRCAPSSPPPRRSRRRRSRRLPGSRAGKLLRRRCGGPGRPRLGRGGAGRLAGGAGGAGRAARRAGRSRLEESAPCLRAEAGPCEPPT